MVGKILEDNNEFLTALHAFEKAQKDPAYKAKSLLERGKCYISTGDPDMGLNELERALSNSKRKSGAEILQIRYWLAHCYEKTHVIEKALDQWLKIHAMQPSFKDVKEKLKQYQGH